MFLLLAAFHPAGNSQPRAQRHLTTLGIVAELQTGEGAHAIITGDFNGDGLTDIATLANLQVFLYYQQRGSSAWKRGTLDEGQAIVAASAGRCNRDRLADIVLLTDDPPEIRVYCAARGEQFVLTWKAGVSELFNNLILADVDNDGRTDILLFGKRHLGIMIMKGRGDGSFLPGATLLKEYSVAALSVEDLNVDGLNDIIASDWISNRLLVFTGFGKLNFSEPSVLQFASEPRFFSTARLDSDFNRDLLVCLPEERRCRLFLGDGLGGFHPSQDVTLNGISRKLGVADVNGDGKDDIGVLSQDERSLMIDLNNGEGLGDSVVYSAGGVPTDFSFIKHGLTGLVDAIILDSAASRLRFFYNAMINRGPIRDKIYALGLHPEGLLAADVDHDGWNDIVVADSKSRDLSLFLNDGKGGFDGRISFRTKSALKELEFVPKNDSIALFVGTNPDTTTTSIVEINTNSYSHTVVDLPTQGEQTILSARVDSTNRFLHLMVLEHERLRGGGEPIEYEQIGPARFIERTVTTRLTRPIIAATVCDCNRDGYPDIISLVDEGRGGKESVYFSPGASAESFRRPRLVLSLDSARPAGALLWNADLNRDSISDLIVNFQAPRNLLAVSLGRKDTTFTPGYFRLRTPVSVSSKGNLKVVDINDDGIMDLVVVNDVDRSIEVYLGMGDGTFVPGPHLISTRGLGGFTLEDVNRDGIPELILTDSRSGVLKILSLEDEK